MAPGVDLVVNTFERTYRTVLAPGFFDSIVAQNRFAFARRLALINNVSDPPDARRRAQALIAAGEIDGCVEVAGELGRALSLAGLTRAQLGRIAHYSDCSLVAVTLDGPEHVLYWDADVSLQAAHDWITPSLALLAGDPRVLVANPRWTMDERMAQVTLFRRGEFALGRGFSDQMYLVRRRDFAAPIYGQRCAAALRFPMSAVAPVFEARVDAHMRHHDLLRATYLQARYTHPVMPSGTATEQLGVAERARGLRNRVVLKAIHVSPWKKQCCLYM
ncbi:MAG: hypothetical protein ACRDMX_16570 [Solirubrobacteraceae bacterium]